MKQAVLGPELVSDIQTFIKEKREEQKQEFPNVLLREETLKLLEQYCTIIYYPLEAEDNNGFHVDRIPTRAGELRHFVFINTAQTLEKQVFTAAHELGHIWGIDSLAETCGQPDTEALREAMINRFAAELLMPEPYFTEKFVQECKEKITPGGTIRGGDMLRVIVTMMNHFFAPWKAVVLRFHELHILSPKDTEVLLGQGRLSLATIESALDSIKRELGYSRLIRPTMRKWIEGLPELLEQAEQRQAVSQAKIAALRQKFELEKTIIDRTVEEYTITPEERR